MHHNLSKIYRNRRKNAPRRRGKKQYEQRSTGGAVSLQPGCEAPGKDASQRIRDKLRSVRRLETRQHKPELSPPATSHPPGLVADMVDDALSPSFAGGCREPAPPALS